MSAGCTGIIITLCVSQKVYTQGKDAYCVSYAEVSVILELGNVWVFVQLIHRPMRTKNQLYKNSNIA